MRNLDSGSQKVHLVETMSGCICAICYEDVLPASEHLQSISVCGHVFHELCLQQWIEYCPNGSTPTCPLCKQNCAARNTYRLYFQHSDSVKASSQKTSSGTARTSEDYEAQVRKLEARVQLLADACKFANAQIMDLNGKETERLELLRTLEADLDKMKKEKGKLVDTLGRTREELKRKMDDRQELLESNRAMSKDLAAHRLAADVDLTEDDMLKLAGMRLGANKDAVIDILKKSLLLRNMAFKELMGKCRELGLGESRALAKSAKLMQQVKRLKSRVEDVAKVEEKQGNASLRSLIGVTTSRSSAGTPRSSLKSCYVDGLQNNASLFHSKSSKLRKEAGSRLEPSVLNPESDWFSDEVHQDFHTKKMNGVGNIEDVSETSRSLGERNMHRRVVGEESNQFEMGHVTTQNSRGGGSLARNDLSTVSGRSSDEAVDVDYQGLSAGARQESSAGRSIFVGAGSRQQLDQLDEATQHHRQQTVDLDSDIEIMEVMLPIRRERGLGQEMTRPEFVGGTNRRFALSGGSNAEGSKFIVSGADGRGDRVTILKPPRLFPGGESSMSKVKKAKRLSQIAGCVGSRSALKIEHFFGRK